MSGPNLRLKEQRGRVVMVNFWATWCAPCRQEMPQLEPPVREVQVAPASSCSASTSTTTRARRPRSRPSSASRFPVLLDTEKSVSKLYDVSTMPSTVIIDRDGKVRYVHRGYLAGYEENYEKQIRELLK